MYNGHQVTIHQIKIKKNMMYKGVIVLSFTIEYPQFSSSMMMPCLIKVNQYYKMKATQLQNNLETTMYQEAITDYQESLVNKYPFNLHEVILGYKITYNQNCAISLYFDQYQFTGGAHGQTTRTSDTWNLNDGKLYQLSNFFSNDYKKDIIDIIDLDISNKIKNDQGYFFDDYKKLVIQSFNINNFYLTKEGIIIYFQQYDIAPYSSGIIEFLIPYSKNNPRPPKCLDNNFKQ